MDSMYVQPIVEMGVALSELAIKRTTTNVTNKIKNVKEEKNCEKLRSVYDEIVNEILLERDEAVRIAQAYKSEIDRIVINDDDIAHLHNTISDVLDLLKKLSPEMDVQSFEVFKDLISVDTLKTMQLVGFNYKVAIGEPLTELCANAIKNMGKKEKVNSGKK